MIKPTHTSNAWNRLDKELEIWSDAGLKAQFWWRDDDAIAATPALNELTALSDEFNVPIALAVIPALLEPSLARDIRSNQKVTVLQHGYLHANHAACGQKKIELGGTQPQPMIESELRSGLKILSTQFAEQFVPVLVPPWNRIRPSLLSSLSDIGFKGVSSMWAYKKDTNSTALRQYNTHLDPVAWRHGRGFVGSHVALAQICQHLIAKRSGYRDSEEPTGLLTHHLVQRDAVWKFCRQLMSHLNQHPAVHWKSASTMWAG